jgi:hypothetical protein
MVCSRPDYFQLHSSSLFSSTQAQLFCSFVCAARNNGLGETGLETNHEFLSDCLKGSSVETAEKAKYGQRAVAEVKRQSSSVPIDHHRRSIQPSTGKSTAADEPPDRTSRP